MPVMSWTLLPSKRGVDFENVLFGLTEPSRPVELSYETEGDWAALKVVIMPMAVL